jgi:GrpB-like predicted nucleotidyltransferase (UPF0157 family)/cytidylate kinase
MNTIIHIFGASGTGTSTLGMELERDYGFKWLDTDYYFWKPTDPPFVQSRPYEERIALLGKDIKANSKCVITGSMCGWGDAFISELALAVFVDAPTAIRIDRLDKREYERFGERIREGGDMFEEHTRFIEWAKTYETDSSTGRCRRLHYDWMKTLPCSIMRLDGADDYRANSAAIAQRYHEMERANISTIILSEYNPVWMEEFERLKSHLISAVGDLAVEIHHVGSTAVPGLTAKPILDIDIEIADMGVFMQIKDRLTDLGYRHEGNLGIDKREAFKYSVTNFMAHHLYVCPSDSPELCRHIIFRDYLITHPETAAEYAALKRKLKNEFEHDREGYTEAKSEFVQEIIKTVGDSYDNK